MKPPQPALVEADDVRVAGHTGAEEVRQSLREVDPAPGTESLAAPQPEERVGGQTLPHRDQTSVKRVRRRQCARVEPVATEARHAPVAVAPELKLGELTLLPQDPLQRLGPGRRAVGGIDPPEAAVEPRAR